MNGAERGYGDSLHCAISLSDYNLSKDPHVHLMKINLQDSSQSSGGSAPFSEWIELGVADLDDLEVMSVEVDGVNRGRQTLPRRV